MHVNVFLHFLHFLFSFMISILHLMCFFKRLWGLGARFVLGALTLPILTNLIHSQWRTSWRFDVLTTTFEKTWRIQPRLPRTKPSEKPFHTLWRSSVFPTCFQHVSTFQAHSEHKHGLDSFAWSIWVSYEHYIIRIIWKAKSCTCIHACERGCIKDQWQWQAMSSN